MPPLAVSLFGSQFLTWRGIRWPVFVRMSVPVADSKTVCASARSAKAIVSLFQPGHGGEQVQGLSVRFMGINRNAIASYLISLYCSLAVQTPDALAVLDGVEVGKYHEYPDTYK